MVVRFLTPWGGGASFLTQHFVPVFSSELARHVNNPGGLGLDDLSLAWSKYELLACGGPQRDESPQVPVGRVDGHGKMSASKTSSGMLLVWKCRLAAPFPW